MSLLRAALEQGNRELEQDRKSKAVLFIELGTRAAWQLLEQSGDHR